MKHLGIFLAGFASGWVVRSTVDSSRSLAVSGVSAVFGTLDRVRRVVAMEREHLADLVAEGKAKHEATLRTARRSSSASDVAGEGVRAAASVRPSVRAA